MDGASSLEVVQQKLPLRLRALWQEDADYYGDGAPVTEFRPVAMAVDTPDDGVPDLVVVSEVREPGRRQEDDVSRHRFDAEWRARVDSGRGSYVAWVARRIHHGAGRQREPDHDTRRSASADLPATDVLWRQAVEALDGGLDAAGRMVVGEITVAVTPEQWRDLVVRCEVAARKDRGPDALRRGDGPRSAIDALDELLPGGWGGAGPWSGYVVWWREALHPSSRLELPPL